MNHAAETTPTSSAGNVGLDAVVDLIAERLAARLRLADGPRLLTVAEAAAYIGRTEKAVRHLIANHALPVVREGRALHLDRGDLDRWVELRKTQS